ncbi:hypothetical protein SI65_06437 [Aspergillus cristatus]|uniref:SET domain-containing protein n=1 Tax=Aspergillus cristatus TaxID=573508 RepID=A0A1E3BC66_ASPCR|nr:hypothetical protein SI65_06437 [Aspergillus cristatus]
MNMNKPLFAQMVDWETQGMVRAEARKGQRPGKAPREKVIKEFMAQREEMSKLSPDRPRFSFFSRAYHPCIRSLSELKKTMLNDLILETHHRDRHLLLRSVTQSYRDNGAFSIVEDENGDVMWLELYYQDRQRDVEDIVKEGSVLIVKEPYLRPNGEGGHGIYVDQVSDLIRLPEYDERIPAAWRSDGSDLQLSAESWKTKGNDYFNSRMYDNAIECYTRGLDCSPTTDEIRALGLKRSIAFIKTKQFAAALADADSAIAATGPTEKALTRKVQALYNLDRFQECCEILKGLLEENPSNAAAQNELARATERLAEQETGSYEFKKFHEAANKLRPPLLDHATYIGPVVVKEAGSYGRGLFTTKEVKAGDLLLCAKAFGFAFADPEHRRDVTMVYKMELIRAISQKMYANPSLTSVITDLHADGYKSVDVAEVDGKPVVDTFQIERIIDANAFGSQNSAAQNHIEETLYKREGIAINQDKSSFHSLGVWPMTSHANHSCYANSQSSITGDMLILRATQDIPANTEITLAYKDPVPDFDEERTRFRSWNFVCDCPLCKDAHNTCKRIHNNRVHLRKQATSRYARSSTIKREALAASLEQTYARPPTLVPRVALFDIYLDLARDYMRKQQPEKAVAAALKTFESLGFVIEGGELPHVPGTQLVVKHWGMFQDESAECWTVLVCVYSVLAPEICQKAEEYARVAYRMAVGEDETFEETPYHVIRQGRVVEVGEGRGRIGLLAL